MDWLKQTAFTIDLRKCPGTFYVHLNRQLDISSTRPERSFQISAPFRLARTNRFILDPKRALPLNNAIMNWWVINNKNFIAISNRSPIQRTLRKPSTRRCFTRPNEA